MPRVRGATKENWLPVSVRPGSSKHLIPNTNCAVVHTKTGSQLGSGFRCSFTRLLKNFTYSYSGSVHSIYTANRPYFEHPFRAFPRFPFFLRGLRVSAVSFPRPCSSRRWAGELWL